MGNALVGGLIASGRAHPSGIVVAEARDERRAWLSKQHGVLTHASAAEAVSGCDIVVLAVKPEGAASTCEEVAARLEHGTPVLSIMAGVTIATLESWFAAGTPVVRAMPNTAALVGRAVSAIAAGRHAGEADLELSEQVLTSVGVVVRLDESKLDAVTALSGSGPAYVFLVAEALIEGGVAMGLPRDVATILAENTIAGAAQLLLDTGEAPADLRAQVTSPAGTTAAGLAALERHAVRYAFIEAVRAAAARSAELGA